MTAPARTPPRVLAVASHPIQYQAPWFRALAAEPGMDFSVLFIEQPDAKAQGRGFGVAFSWDIPLLDGYRWQVAEGVAGAGVLQGFFGARLTDPAGLLMRLAPDVLILTGWHVWPLVQILRAARRLRIPVVMRGESNALRPRPLAAWLAHRRLLAHCAAFLPIGVASRAFYTNYGIAPERLFDAPYFVDNHRFEAAAASLADSRAALRSRWRVPDGATCFLYAGKLEPKKRILDLLAALAIARAKSRAPLHLLVVGTGELQAEAQAVARAQSLPVTFAGFLNQSEMPEAYVACDALVLPSDYGETWGLVVNEAMACSRAAIVSDRVGCGPDLIRHGVTGLTFAFGDPGALARELARAANHPELLVGMGEHARERVLAHCTVEGAAAATLRAVNFARGGA